MKAKVRKRILVIERDPTINEQAVEVLRGVDFECDTASDGILAQKLLRRQIYDVIVTDLQRTTVELLEKLFERKERPLIVVLASDPNVVESLIEHGANEFISKPLDPDLLVSKIQALFECEKVSEESLIRTLKRQTSIQPISSAALLTYDLANSKEVSTKQIAYTLGQDQALAIQVLKISNSVFYNPAGNKVSDLEGAIVKLGRKLVGEMALAISTQKAFASTKIPWMDVDLTWQRGVAASLAIKLLVQRGGHEEISEGLFVSALVHLTGRVLLATLYAEQYETILRLWQKKETTLEEQEQLVFPWSHAGVMARQLQFWNLPQEVYRPLRFMMLDESTMEKLQEPSRTRVELLRLAALVAKFTTERWEPWNYVPSLPSEKTLSALKIDSLRDIRSRTRKELGDIRALLSALDDEDPTQESPVPESIEEEESASGKVLYFSMVEEKMDLVEEFVLSMGIRLTRSRQEDSTCVLINGVGCSDKQLSSHKDADFPNKSLMILCNADQAKHITSNGSIVTLPARYDELEKKLQQFGNR